MDYNSIFPPAPVISDTYIKKDIDDFISTIQNNGAVHNIEFRNPASRLDYPRENRIIEFTDNIGVTDETGAHVPVGRIKGYRVTDQLISDNPKTFLNFCDSESEDLITVAREMNQVVNTTFGGHVRRINDSAYHDPDDIPSEYDWIILDQITLSDRIRGHDLLGHLLADLDVILNTQNTVFVLLASAIQNDDPENQKKLVKQYARYGFLIVGTPPPSNHPIMACHIDSLGAIYRDKNPGENCRDLGNLPVMKCRRCGNPMVTIPGDRPTHLHIRMDNTFHGIYGMKGCRAATLDTFGEWDDTLDRAWKALPTLTR